MRLVDETEADLRALIENDFGPLDPSVDLWDASLDWIHYRARRIPQRPRQVTMSNEVESHRSTYPAFDQIASQLRMGEDVTPWLSDTIGRKRTDPKADLMFNDWQIIHFHLGNVFATPNKIARTSDLLFAYITDDRSVFINVLPHGSWTMQALLEILLHTSPSDMERSELKNVVGVSHHYTADEVYTLRKSGVNAAFEIDNRIFMAPGFGITSSRHAARSTFYLMKLRRALKSVLAAIEKNELPVHLMSMISADLSLPVRVGIRMEGGHLIFYDKNRQIDLMYMPALE